MHDEAEGFGISPWSRSRSISHLTELKLSGRSPYSDPAFPQLSDQVGIKVGKSTSYYAVAQVTNPLTEALELLDTRQGRARPVVS